MGNKAVLLSFMTTNPKNPQQECQNITLIPTAGEILTRPLLAQLEETQELLCVCEAWLVSVTDADGGGLRAPEREGLTPGFQYWV